MDLRLQKKLPRGLRNNNPANLVITNISWFGKVPKSENTDGKFEQFTDVRYGLRALRKDLTNDIGKGLDTVQKLISSYAPPSENNTGSYISVVSSALAKHKDTKLTADRETLFKLIKAIITHENGKQAQVIKDETILESIDNNFFFDLKNDTVKKYLEWIIGGLLLVVGAVFAYLAYTFKPSGTVRLSRKKWYIGLAVVSFVAAPVAFFWDKVSAWYQTYMKSKPTVGRK